MRSEPRRFLLAMWEGGGTIPPQLGVARRLLERGHEVHVLGDPTIRDEALAVGCSFSPYERAPHRTSLDPDEDLLRDWEARNPLEMLRRVRDVFITKPAGDYARDTLATIERVRPDVVVPDVNLFGVTLAAQAAGLPVALLVPNIWMLPIKGVPAIGPGFPLARGPLGRLRDRAMLAVVSRLFNQGLGSLNATRAEHGLPPLTSLFEQALGADRILVMTSPSFDFASSFVPANVGYVGPILDDPLWAEEWSPPWPEENQDPLVLVGFSSTFQDQAPLLARVVGALSELPVRGLVTLGEMLAPDAVASTANVCVVRSAPHTSVLKEAALVVTHCGHGTTLKALAAGVPLVCLPMGRDQNDTAARVEHHGAGLRLSPTASKSAIKRAVARLLRDPSYGAAARTLAARLREEAATLDVTAELEALASTPRGASPRAGAMNPQERGAGPRGARPALEGESA